MIGLHGRRRGLNTGVPLALVLNLLLRLSILHFLGEVLLFPNDPRFAGKAIPIRNFVIVIALSLVFPVAHFVFRRWQRYPFTTDSLYLSIFWLDMAGNSLDLYDRYQYFDLVPHLHGAGAITVVFQQLLRLPMLSALGLSSAVHLLLEAQEYYTDVLFGTHNVRGTADTVNDLLVGLIGSIAYPAIAWLWARRSKSQEQQRSGHAVT